MELSTRKTCAASWGAAGLQWPANPPDRDPAGTAPFFGKGWIPYQGLPTYISFLICWD